MAAAPGVEISAAAAPGAELSPAATQAADIFAAGPAAALSAAVAAGPAAELSSLGYSEGGYAGGCSRSGSLTFVAAISGTNGVRTLQECGHADSSDLSLQPIYQKWRFLHCSPYCHSSWS